MPQGQKASAAQPFRRLATALGAKVRLGLCCSIACVCSSKGVLEWSLLACWSCGGQLDALSVAVLPCYGAGASSGCKVVHVLRAVGCWLLAAIDESEGAAGGANEDMLHMHHLLWQ